MCRSLHPNASVHRLYLPRREGGRGLINIEWLHNRLVIGTVYQIRRSSDPLICMVREAEKDGTQGSILLKAAVRARQALKIPFDAVPASRKKDNILEKPKQELKTLLKRIFGAPTSPRNSGIKLIGTFSKLSWLNYFHIALLSLRLVEHLFENVCNILKDREECKQYVRNKHPTFGFGDAKKKFRQLIPTTFVVTLDDFTTKTICTGRHPNECQESGSSGTKKPMLHELKFKSKTLRIIDTPGLGDTRGITADHENIKALIDFIGQLGHTAISTIAAPGITLRCSKENTFCVDNEAFRCLAASFKGLPFLLEEEKICEQSWNKSSLECKRLLDYILTLHASKTNIIVSVRSANVIIAKLAKPLIEIMVLHGKSIARIEIQKQEIETYKDSLEELNSRLYVPIIEYKSTKKIISDTKHGHQVRVGTSILQSLFGIDGTYKYVNMTEIHSEETIEPYETKREDASVKNTMLSESKRLALVKQSLVDLLQVQDEYKEESRNIVAAAAIFVVFLKKNAVTSTQDPFQNYIQSVLDEERTCGGSLHLINNLESLLCMYNAKKHSLMNNDYGDTKLLNLEWYS
ncbi:hypothetical protein Trydic_g9837 [Trypoxylus dichotomus]